MELRLLLGVLRAAAALVLALALSGAALAAYSAHSRTVSPEARTSLLLDPDGGRPAGSAAFVGDPDRYVEGEMSIMRSRAVAAAAADGLTGVTSDDLGKAISVSQQAGSSVVQITAKAATTRLARSEADAVAHAYIDARQSANGRRRKAQLAAVDGDIASVLQQLQQTQSRIGTGLPAPVDAVSRDALLRRYDQLVTTRAELAVPSEANDRTAVIEAAIAVPQSGSRKLVLFALLGFIVGGALGAALAVGWTLLVPRVLEARQAEYIVGVPAIAEVAFPRSESTALELLSPTTIRAMHRVAASVASVRIERSPRLIAVCSTSASGNSFLAAGSLARAYADERFRVVYLSIPDAERLAERLTDSPNERPAVVAGRAAGPASAGFLGDRDSRLEHWDIQERLPFLSVAQPNSPWAYPVDGERLEMLRRGLEPHADIVVVELPPLLESAVSASAAHAADDVVLVVPVPQQSESELDLARQVVLETLAPRLHLLIARRSRRGG